MNINASIASNFFLKKGWKEKIPISVMKLIKLVYIGHGWSLAVLDQDLLDGEEVEAWPHGPVIPSLYHEFKRFGKDPIPIDELAISLVEDGYNEFTDEAIFLEKMDLDKEVRKDVTMVLDTVWKSYRNYSAWGLSRKTHQEGAPWQQANQKFIDNDLIKKYYTDFLKNLLQRK